MLRLISIAFFLFISVKAQGQEKLLLWPEGFVPNQKVSQEKERITETDIVRIENVQNPSIEIYLPSKSNSSFCQIIWSHLHLNFVTLKNSNSILTKFSSSVC